MNYWYFNFEGRFVSGSPEHGCKGVFSSSLVPESDYEKAKGSFMRSLAKMHIDLVKVKKEFEVDGDELDQADPENKFWIEFYNEARQVNEPIFDKLHVF